MKYITIGFILFTASLSPQEVELRRMEVILKGTLLEAQNRDKIILTILDQAELGCAIEQLMENWATAGNHD